MTPKRIEFRCYRTFLIKNQHWLTAQWEQALLEGGFPLLAPIESHQSQTAFVTYRCHSCIHWFESFLVALLSLHDWLCLLSWWTRSCLHKNTQLPILISTHHCPKTMHNSFHVARSSEGKWQINVFAAEHLALPDCLSFDMTETGIISVLCSRSTSTLSGQPAFFIMFETLMNNQLPKRAKENPNAVLQARLS